MSGNYENEINFLGGLGYSIDNNPASSKHITPETSIEDRIKIASELTHGINSPLEFVGFLLNRYDIQGAENPKRAFDKMIITYSNVGSILHENVTELLETDQVDQAISRFDIQEMEGQIEINYIGKKSKFTDNANKLKPDVFHYTSRDAEFLKRIINEGGSIEKKYITVKDKEGNKKDILEGEEGYKTSGSDIIDTGKVVFTAQEISKQKSIQKDIYPSVSNILFIIDGQDPDYSIEELKKTWISEVNNRREGFERVVSGGSISKLDELVDPNSEHNTAENIRDKIRFINNNLSSELLSGEFAKQLIVLTASVHGARPSIDFYGAGNDFSGLHLWNTLSEMGRAGHMIYIGEGGSGKTQKARAAQYIFARAFGDDPEIAKHFDPATLRELNTFGETFYHRDRTQQNFDPKRLVIFNSAGYLAEGALNKELIGDLASSLIPSQLFTKEAKDQLVNIDKKFPLPESIKPQDLDILVGPNPIMLFNKKNKYIDEIKTFLQTEDNGDDIKSLAARLAVNRGIARTENEFKRIVAIANLELSEENKFRKNLNYKDIKGISETEFYDKQATDEQITGIIKHALGI